MIGWHYTSEDCWQRIQYEGLTPYTLKHPSVISQPCPREEIWLYRERQYRLSHLGCLLWQMHSKMVTNLVLLKVQYSNTDATFACMHKFFDPCECSSHTLTLKHDLTEGDMVFHTKAPAILVWRSIPPRRIQLAGSYDLIDLADPAINTSVINVGSLELALTQ